MSKSGAIEAADEVFKHIAAVHGGNLVRAQVSLGGVELLDDQVQGVALHHALDDVVELKLGQHVLHVGGEAGEVVTEVGLDVLRVSQQRLKGVLGRVVELATRGANHKTVKHFKMLVLLIVQHIVVGRHELHLATCGHLNYDGKTRVLFCQASQHVVFFGERNRSLLQEGAGNKQGTGIKAHSTIRIHNSNSFLYLVD